MFDISNSPIWHSIYPARRPNLFYPQNYKILFVEQRRSLVFCGTIILCYEHTRMLKITAFWN